MSRDFSLSDFRQQCERVRRLGSPDLVGCLLHGGRLPDPWWEDSEKVLNHIQGMIDAMTRAERHDPSLIDLSRSRRIARGSGTTPQEVRTFLRSFEQVQILMRQFDRMTVWERIKMI